MAILRKDLQSIKVHAQALNGGELYPLLACIITARSWDSIRTGVDRTAVNRAEVSETDGRTHDTSFPWVCSGLNTSESALRCTVALHSVLLGIMASGEFACACSVVWWFVGI